jgi:hypothetical protein
MAHSVPTYSKSNFVTEGRQGRFGTEREALYSVLVILLLFSLIYRVRVPSIIPNTCPGTIDHSEYSTPSIVAASPLRSLTA